MRRGSDEARVWARRLTFRSKPEGPGDVRMKSVLMAICNYVDENAIAWPSIATLADDTDQSYDSVRRRLRDLETLGLVVRFARFVDDTGRINNDGAGRRTSDELRLVLTTTQEDVTPRVVALTGSRRSSAEDSDPPMDDADTAVAPVPVDPCQQQGTPPLPAAGVRPPQPAGGYLAVRPEQEHSTEPEDSPPTPQRGESVKPNGQEDQSGHWPHAETWKQFETAWTEPILHQRMCRDVWSTFTDLERQRAIRVARGYVNWRKAQRKPPNVCNAQKILREREAWPAYEKLAGPDPALRTFVREGSREFDALAVTALIGSWTLPPTQFDVEQAAKGIWRSTPVDPDQLGLAIFAEKPIEQWTTLEPGTTPHIAWSARLRQWVGKAPPSIRVPCLFPPRRDGSIGPDVEQTDANLKKTG